LVDLAQAESHSVVLASADSESPAEPAEYQAGFHYQADCPESPADSQAGYKSAG
jgi:hypothetical protein